ncbi:hypothetical protein P7C70_g8637, partial [Phenoliferia sp. Uapishka_3]
MERRNMSTGYPNAREMISDDLESVHITTPLPYTPPPELPPLPLLSKLAQLWKQHISARLTSESYFAPPLRPNDPRNKEKRAEIHRLKKRLDNAHRAEEDQRKKKEKLLVSEYAVRAWREGEREWRGHAATVEEVGGWIGKMREERENLEWEEEERREIFLAERG